jgi:DNA replication factor GINS
MEEPENTPETSENEISKPSMDNKNPIKTVIILEELPAIMGVDREIYGPLVPQDIVAMPEANAQIIIKNNKGRFLQKHEKISYR